MVSTQIKTKKVDFKQSLVKGWFRLTDGTKTEFTIDQQGNWTQWGNTSDNLNVSIPFLQELSQFLVND